MTPLAVALSGVIGLPIGSFLSVVVHRVPEGASIVTPASRCPSCGQPIRTFDNIPVLSYVLRRGRCRSCRARIPLRYPLLEIVTAGLFCAIAARVGSLWALPAYCVLAASLVALSVIDLERMRLPSSIIYTTALVGAPLLVLGAAGTHSWSSLVHAALAGIGAFAMFLLLFFVVPGGIGFGDVRLAAVCGTFLGWLGLRIALTGFLASFVIGGIVGLAVLASRRGGRKSRIPFGPFLAAGTILAVLFGADIARIWLG